MNALLFFALFLFCFFLLQADFHTFLNIQKCCGMGILLGVAPFPLPTLSIRALARRSA